MCDVVFTAHVFSFLNVSSYKHVASSRGSDTESVRMAQIRLLGVERGLKQTGTKLLNTVHIGYEAHLYLFSIFNVIFRTFN